MRKILFVFSLILSFILSFNITWSNFYALTASAWATQPPIHSAISPKKTEILQFTSAGHVLGFHKSGVYMATGNHLLWECFVDTKGVSPLADHLPTKNGRDESLGSVSYSNLWDGISLTYDKPSEGVLRSTFQVAPGANPDKIGLCYNVPAYIDHAGNLVFTFKTGTMTASAPIAWQEIKGKNQPIEVAFHFDNSRSTIHYSLGSYNPELPLFIDPTLSWNTFIGSGSKADRGHAITTDESGNVYVAGFSDAAWGSPVNDHAGTRDSFAAKFNNSGTLQWHTFMGSSDDDFSMGIDVDVSGNVYVTGYSESGWGDSPVNAHAGDQDVFVTKLNSSGERQWNTFLGSSDIDHGNGIAVDSSGNIYVTGDSKITWGDSPVNAHAGGQGEDEYADAFIAKLNSSGALQWHTFMGSTSHEASYAIVLDGSVNIYITGESYVSWGTPVNAHAGNCEAFVAKLDSDGTPQWHTFMGSTSYEYGYGIALDGSGNIYVAGCSSATWGSPVHAHAGGQDAFAAKLSNSGVLEWHTFMGSTSTDYGNDLDVDENKNVYVTGHSFATWGSPTIAYSGSFDAFVAMLDSSGVLQGHSFIGASPIDFGMAITVDSSGNAYVTGESDATWGGSPVSAHSGWMDVFVAKFLMPSQTKTLAPVFLLLLE